MNVRNHRTQEPLDKRRSSWGCGPSNLEAGCSMVAIKTEEQHVHRCWCGQEESSTSPCPMNGAVSQREERVEKVEKRVNQEQRVLRPKPRETTSCQSKTTTVTLVKPDGPTTRSQRREQQIAAKRARESEEEREEETPQGAPLREKKTKIGKKRPPRRRNSEETRDGRIAWAGNRNNRGGGGCRPIPREYLLKYGQRYCPFCDELFNLSQEGLMGLKRHLAQELYFNYDRPLSHGNPEIDRVTTLYKQWIDRFACEQMHADLYIDPPGSATPRRGQRYYECPLCLKVFQLLKNATKRNRTSDISASSQPNQPATPPTQSRPPKFLQRDAMINHLYHHLRWGGRKCTFCTEKYLINSAEEIEKHFNEHHYDMVPKSANRSTRYEAIRVVMAWYDKFEPMETYVEKLIDQSEKEAEARHGRVVEIDLSEPTTSANSLHPEASSSQANPGPSGDNYSALDCGRRPEANRPSTSHANSSYAERRSKY